MSRAALAGVIVGAIVYGYAGSVLTGIVVGAAVALALSWVKVVG